MEESNKDERAPIASALSVIEWALVGIATGAMVAIASVLSKLGGGISFTDGMIICVFAVLFDHYLHGDKKEGK